MMNDEGNNVTNLNYKEQIPNIKQIPMTEIQNPKPICDLEERATKCFGHWILKFGIYLYFGAWNLKFFNASKGQSLKSL